MERSLCLLLPHLVVAFAMAEAVQRKAGQDSATDFFHEHQPQRVQWMAAVQSSQDLENPVADVAPWDEEKRSAKDSSTC